MKRLVGTEEAARIRNVSPRTIRREFERGELEGEFRTNNRGGKSGQKLFVYINDEPHSAERTPLNTGATSVVAHSEFKKTESPPSPPPSPARGEGVSKDRYRIHPGEPGCHVVTPMKDGAPITIQTGCHQEQGMSGRTSRAIPSCDPLPPERGEGRECIASTGLTPARIHASEQDAADRAPEIRGINQNINLAPAPSAPAILGPPGDPGADVSNQINPDGEMGESGDGGKKPDGAQNLPTIYNDTPSTGSGCRKVPESCQKIANLRFALIQAFNEELAKNHRPKTEIIRQFLDIYNAGLLLPEVRRELGSISRATLYNWLLATTPEDLTPQYGGAGISKITDHERNFLLTLLLHQNRLKIAYAITLTKEYLRKKEIESPSSPATLRRFIDQFKKEHYDIWTLRREGEKALNDKVIPYAERDWHLLEVGEGLVADGHRLNFQIIHPVTGKPCRAALVLFWDWKSSFSLGWEIMIEENIQCVASALRNAIIELGKTPKWVLLDNGKAFKAKIFTEDISFDDTELPGMFARLNINYHFAQPYNAQAKPIERIFGILNEQLERLVPSYTGASIEDKPAWTKRNEKYARSLHNPDVPDIEEANHLIRSWRDRYAERPSRGRDGLRPIDIFNEGKGPGVDPNELIYLMMDREIKDTHRNGVTWLGWHWNDEALYGLKDKVVIRYSLSDLSQIYVFHKNEFLCAAKPIERVHPMASESENPRDMEAVKEVFRLKKKVKNTTRKLCDLLDTKTASQIDWSRTKTTEISETIQKIEETKKPKVARIWQFDSNAPQAVCTPSPEASITEGASGLTDLNARPAFNADYEKYEWLQAHPDLVTDLDREWTEDFFSRNSLYKNAARG